MEPGESEHEAIQREVAEETGLRIRVLRLAGRVNRPAPAGGVYDIGDYVCELAEDSAHNPVAGDDADEVRWVGSAEYATLRVMDGMHELLTEWGVLPPGWPAARPG